MPTVTYQGLVAVVRSSYTGWRNSGAFPDRQSGPGIRHKGAARSARTRAAQFEAGKEEEMDGVFAHAQRPGEPLTVLTRAGRAG